MERYQPVSMLLVEDNPDDVLIAQRALSKSRLANELHIARDGQEALDLLFEQGRYANGATAPSPDLVLLDLNLPKVNGIEVLEQLRASEKHRLTPIVMLTASIREEDIARSYRSGSNTYIPKPVQFEEFLHAVEILGQYWLMIAKLPPKAA